MKIVVFSDTHVHAWNEHSRDVGGVPSRLLHTVSVIDDVTRYCVEHGVGLVVHGGDLFHKRNVLYTQAYTLVVEALVRMREAGITLLAVVGNHDMANRDGSIHSLQALAANDLLSVVPADQGWFNWHVEDDRGDEVVVTGVSYCDAVATFEQRTFQSTEAYLREHRGVPRLGVMHHGFKGARVGTALEYEVREAIDVIGLRGMDFRWIYSGHYHTSQLVGSGDALYIGSPMEFVRGEEGRPKGFRVYDTAKPEEDVLVPITRPRFVRLTAEQIADASFDVRRHCQGNFVDVVFEELPVRWEDLAQMLVTEGGAEGVRPVPIGRPKTEKSSRLEVDASLGERAVLEAYLDHKAKDGGLDEFDRDALLRAGLDLLERGAKR